MSPNHEYIREMIIYFLRPLAYLYEGFLKKKEIDVDAAFIDLDTAEIFAEAIRDHVEGIRCFSFLKELKLMELANLYECLPASRHQGGFND